MLLISLGIRLEGFTEVKIYSMVWVKITAPCGVVHGHSYFCEGEEEYIFISHLKMGSVGAHPQNCAMA
jgi:hypothetical protein